jgi:hypothetical protein
VDATDRADWVVNYLRDNIPDTVDFLGASIDALHARAKGAVLDEVKQRKDTGVDF